MVKVAVSVKPFSAINLFSVVPKIEEACQTFLSEVLTQQNLATQQEAILPLLIHPLHHLLFCYVFFIPLQLSSTFLKFPSHLIYSIIKDTDV